MTCRLYLDKIHVPKLLPQLIFTWVFYWKTTAISTYAPQIVAIVLFLVGVHCEFQKGCHFSNYGEKLRFDDFIVSLTEEFTDDSRS